MGFSKGVVVLNQVVRELDSKRPGQLNLATMVWLDGGHNGGRDIWLTDARLLRALVEAGTKVVVRVTPYQVKNSNRPWVGREEKVFTSSLAPFLSQGAAASFLSHSILCVYLAAATAQTDAAAEARMGVQTACQKGE